MWQALAGLALNIGEKNKAKAEKNRMDIQAIGNEQEQIKRQNVLQSRTAVDQQQLQGMQNARQQAFQRQQSVLDEIMNKYRIGGGGIQ